MCYSRESQNVKPFQCEEPWQNSAGPQPLVDLAALQKEPNYAIVCHHYKLALSMHLMLVYGLKSKPISLFDLRVGLDLFFLNFCCSFLFLSI